jgi:hypothetical protein
VTHQRADVDHGDLGELADPHLHRQCRHYPAEANPHSAATNKWNGNTREVYGSGTRLSIGAVRGVGAYSCTDARSGCRCRRLSAGTMTLVGTWSQKASGYHRQARVENAFFRYKSIIGDDLRARSPAGQGTEAVLACNLLNQMTQRGRACVVRRWAMTGLCVGIFAGWLRFMHQRIVSSPCLDASRVIVPLPIGFPSPILPGDPMAFNGNPLQDA